MNRWKGSKKKWEHGTERDKEVEALRGKKENEKFQIEWNKRKQDHELKKSIVTKNFKKKIEINEQRKKKKETGIIWMMRNAFEYRHDTQWKG